MSTYTSIIICKWQATGTGKSTKFSYNKSHRPILFLNVTQRQPKVSISYQLTITRCSVYQEILYHQWKTQSLLCSQQLANEAHRARKIWPTSWPPNFLRLSLILFSHLHQVFKVIPFLHISTTILNDRNRVWKPIRFFNSGKV